MAKARKPKNEEPKSFNSGSMVRHQKLCLSIDMDNHRVYGYTELEIVVPESGIIGLHADNLEIEAVLVDGEPVEFDFFPHFQPVEIENRWCSVSSSCSAAEAAGATYISALERELIPNLLIMCFNPMMSVSEQQGQPNPENGEQCSGEPKQNVKLVRVDYWVDKAETGIYFKDNVMHTHNQLKREHCWFPCTDDSSQRCCYDLEFTVAQDLVAVSTGSLLYQVLSKDDPPRKTYVYRLDVPVAARWISLAVGPFQILSNHHSGMVSHMCMPATFSKLQHTMDFFNNAFSHYEDFLSAPFPFGSYKQVFIDPEMIISPLSLGASMSIFSSQVLFDEKVIDQTIDTRIKIAYALARQWFGVYITAEEPLDEWLLDGLAGVLTDSFIKRFLGNNEARFRRYKANCVVCKSDDSGATALSSFSSTSELYGTQSIGLLGKLRSWKSVAVLQMLEKQMGPESFRKILQRILIRSQDSTNPFRTLSTKEFRHLANKVGNLERPFLKEFFPRWVGSCGCPMLRMGFSYNKRKNMLELAVVRGCTAMPDPSPTSVPNGGNPSTEKREGEIGWPGMMSIRVHEFDGMYDHPILPMSGEAWQLLEIQCHSKLAAKRFLKPKKGSKPDGSDDNGDTGPATLDARSNTESPLIWLRADPEMEYLAEIHFNQPVQMWINQLERDKDVVAQSQAIGALEALPQLSFSVINALNNFLSDSKAFWRVRIEAAFALANTASEETDWAGLLHLVKFYKSRRFDVSIGLPKPNDFHDFPEYFVLEAIPHAIAMVRAADKKSPREAVEFILQLLKYNDNNGNPYSDVYWLAALVESVGELEFGQQSILFLSSLLKRIDRLLQFDRLMPSYNGILSISCIRTLTRIALKLSKFIPLDRVVDLIKPFHDCKTLWQVRVEASRALLDLEFHSRGIDTTLLTFIKFLGEEPSLRGQVKLGSHTMRLCQVRNGPESGGDIDSDTLVALLRVLESRIAFNNIFVRHQLFCILQILAGRSPTLYGIPRNQFSHFGRSETGSDQNNFFAALVTPNKPPELPLDSGNISHGGLALPEASKEADTVSNSNRHKKPVVKIRLKQSTTSSREKSQGPIIEIDRCASSSISVDAPPPRNFTEMVSISNNRNLEEVNSCHDHGSHMTASIGSVKITNNAEELGKELQCTAESSKVSLHPPQAEVLSSPSIIQDSNAEIHSGKYATDQVLSKTINGLGGGSLPMPMPSVDRHSHSKENGKKKDKGKKRKRDDPEYLERKRLKKEKKKKEKEMAKLLNVDSKPKLLNVDSKPKLPDVNLKQKLLEVDSKQELFNVDSKPPSKDSQYKEVEPVTKPTVRLKLPEPSKVVVSKVDTMKADSGFAPKIRIKLKKRADNS